MHKLGVDFGGVISDRVNDHTDTSFFSDNFLATTATEGSFDTLQKLNSEEQFRNNIWIVSKCKPPNQAKTEQWLAHHQFHEYTGIASDHRFFTPDRIGKLAIARDLELTHFVDDKLEVLGYLVDTVPNLYLFNPKEKEVQTHRWALPHVTVVENWQNLDGLLSAQDS